jgi:hypothetical protein
MDRNLIRENRVTGCKLKHSVSPVIRDNGIVDSVGPEERPTVSPKIFPVDQQANAVDTLMSRNRIEGTVGGEVIVRGGPNRMRLKTTES